MHWLLLALSDYLQIIAMASVVLFAPFSTSWSQAVKVPLLLGSAWGVVRWSTMVFLEVDYPPILGILAVGFLDALYACVSRGIKTFVFLIPVLRKVEKRVRNVLIDTVCQWYGSLFLWNVMLYLCGKFVVMPVCGFKIRISSPSDIICILVSITLYMATRKRSVGRIQR